MNPFLPQDFDRTLVLASRSPRRVDILTGLGIAFEVDPADESVENGVTCDDVFALPQLLAAAKCDDVSRRRPGDVVLAADTVVIHRDQVLTKPRDDAEAESFIARLAGDTHTVVTGLAVDLHERNIALRAAEHTRVTFRPLSDREVQQYVATGEGRDKAGSYAAQGIGAGLIETIDGCFYNVVGLPVARLLDLLMKLREVSP